MIINKPILFYSIILFLGVVCVSRAQEPQGLSVGEFAPGFTATDQFNHAFDLNDQLKKGPVVLMFYRGHWCKYCNKQLEELSDSLEFITDRGATVIAVTPEVMEFVEETSEAHGNSIRILSDQGMKIMDAYQVRFKVDNTTNTKYKIWGIQLAEFNGENGPNLPVPATYIIQQDGTIGYVFFNKDYKKRISVDAILKNL